MSSVETLPGHRSEAFNTARPLGESETHASNALHSDASARSLGFTRSLVPSAVIYEYLSRPAVSGWGLEWFERGWMEVQFLRPVLHGQIVSVESGPVVRAEVDATTRPGSVAELTCATEDGAVVAQAKVGLGDDGAPVPTGRYIEMPPNARKYRPAASPMAFAAMDQLGTVERRASLGDSLAWLNQLSGDPGVYRSLGVMPSVESIRDANRMFDANFELGPWLHVATDTTHLSPLLEGESFSTRGAVVDVYERNNNHFAVLDLLVVAERIRPVAHLMHTVAWKLAVANRQSGDDRAADNNELLDPSL